MPNNFNDDDKDRYSYGVRGGMFSPMRRRPFFSPGGPPSGSQRPPAPPFTPGQPNRNPFVPGPPNRNPFIPGPPNTNPFMPGPPPGRPLPPGPPSGRPLPPEPPQDDNIFPPGPPPSMEPRKGTTQPGFYAIDPGAIRYCVYKYTYIWLENGRSFWTWPVFVGRNSISGYRWNGYRWVYFGTDLDNISDFECY